jgi:hypothetical protein
MKTFYGKKFLVCKNFISKDIADLAGQYLINKSIVTKTMFDVRYISPFDQSQGHFGDKQALGSFSIYGDVLMDTLLALSLEKLQKKINKKLYPTYSYARVYKKGDQLVRHKDKEQCEISATLNLKTDKVWPIFVDPTGGLGNKGIKINLKPGDALFYFGTDHEHWRETFDGEYSAQVFLHYNTSKYKENLYDQRTHLGLPGEFSRKVK